jgi:hypothetical protein
MIKKAASTKKTVHKTTKAMCTCPGPCKVCKPMKKTAKKTVRKTAKKAK